MAALKDGGPDLWVVRHGETEWSRTRLHTGRSDIPLTPAGEQAARALAPRLAGQSFDLELTSPLRRASRTAELAGLHPQLEPRAVEWDYGDYEGLSTQEIKDKVPGWSIWEQGPAGGETLAQVGERADQVIARVLAEAPTRAVLVAHAHFLRVLAARWVQQPPLLAANLFLDTTTIGILSYDRGIPVIETWNT